MTFSSTQKKIATNDPEEPFPDAVTVSSPLWLYVFCAFITPLVLLGAYAVLVGVDDMARRVIGVGVDDMARRVIIVILCVMFLPFVVGHLRTKYICDNTGITVKTKVYLAFFVVINRNTLIPWHDFSSVDYLATYSGSSIGVDGRRKIFEFRTASRDLFNSNKNNIVNINLLYKNSRSALVLAVEHIDRSNFTMDAQEKLEEMGLWL